MARFPRRARLTKPGEFQATLSTGKRHHERWLTAAVSANTLGHPRLGLAIAKKAVGLATQRNRIKRKIRESFRAHQPCLPAVDVVILARSGCAELSAAELDHSLERLWTRIAASSPRS
ncbi:ribonuclease P protein component [Sinimarinibacterium thermocellulolyticum]|uniref:Ribonuclease P protein component n=1 Tax=Sinimarinibacterium thermocellulolyticum TaxID=3170016 RepID=A0ABV2ACU4_9GAMM